MTLSLRGFEERRLALVLSGGGASGIVQVPFLEELIRRGVRPDMIVGSSVGAVNGAFLAFHPDNIEGLADLWIALRDTRLWHRNLLRITRNLLTRGTSVYSNRFLRELFKRHVTIDEIAAAEIPLHIVTTSLSSGRKRVMSRGQLLSSVMASIALPGLFPPVRLEGDWCVDGGLSSGLDLETAILQGATHTLAVDLGVHPSPYQPRGLVDLLARSMEIAVQERTKAEIDQFGSIVPTVVWRPGLRAVSFGSFGDVEELYASAKELAPVMIDQALDLQGDWKPGIYEGVVPVASA
ncbi:MAG: patatin-like phospholipase family protein [Chloroflexota bacterium]|nr:patatin-like phospholipase family protein [Chloroflexota bacterium]MDE2895996.1 patatin-like phospholipase family protein [Chloroflexota bacterium]